jgi:hypothetical protein
MAVYQLRVLKLKLMQKMRKLPRIKKKQRVKEGDSNLFYRETTMINGQTSPAPLLLS